MKGYYTDSSYVGAVNDIWMNFPTEDEYIEYMEENNGKDYKAD